MATREEALEKLDETIQADKERSSVEITAAFQEQKAKMAEIAAAKKEAAATSPGWPLLLLLVTDVTAMVSPPAN